MEAWQASLPSPCQVVLMPSVRDAFHHPTFPQPAINLLAQDQVSTQPGAGRLMGQGGVDIHNLQHLHVLRGMHSRLTVA